MTNTPRSPNRPYLRLITSNPTDQLKKHKESVVVVTSSDAHRNRKNLATLKALGCSFVNNANANDPFLKIFLPVGWKIIKKSPGHMHFEDAKERKRVQIFSQSDKDVRNVYVYRVPRFILRFTKYTYDKTVVGYIQVKDCGKEIHTTKPIFSTTSQDACEKATKIATSWLDGRYPQWRDPRASWD